MLLLTIDNGAGPIDYTKYVNAPSIVITDEINVPALMEFDLVNNDDAFIEPVRSAYVKLESQELSKVIATGFLTNLPEPSFLGVGGNVPSSTFKRFVYHCQVTSDEYLLNVKNIPFFPAFVNQKMGDILKGLAEAIAPGFFDVTNVDAGDIIPFFEYDATRAWTEVAKEFSDAARFRYKVVDKKIFFKPYGDANLGVSYDETVRTSLFSPRALGTQVVTVPPINDVITVGEAEAQRYREDSFIGTGFDFQFPLRHKIFGGTARLLLQEDWTRPTFPVQTFTKTDPGSAIGLNGSLVVDGGTGTLGATNVTSRNGVELGGELIIEHGEVSFFGSASGLLGGLYTSAALLAGDVVAAFDVRESVSVIINASGVEGLLIQPNVEGVLDGFQVTTKFNHHYFLRTVISGRRHTRFTKVYRTLAGATSGGTENSSKVSLTYILEEIPLADPTNPTTHKFTAEVDPGAFAIYAPVNSIDMHLLLNFTAMFRSPQVDLRVQSLYGPSGSQLPPLPANLDPEEKHIVGFAFSDQVATIQTTGDADALVFFADTIPAVGARLRMRSYESKKAIARVRDSVAIAAEAAITGDDGVRKAVIASLRPLPRTSEECDLAAEAIIKDQKDPIYEGQYTFLDDYWDTTEGYPVPGRNFNVNAPSRNISSKDFLVRRVTTRIIELREEKILFSLQYGQDLFVEKALNRFVVFRENILDPVDQADDPSPQEITAIGADFLEPLIDAKVSAISGGIIEVDVGVAAATGFEVRRIDSGWGRNNSGRVGVFTSSPFTLTRSLFDQTWYLRMVDGPRSSRFTTALRVVYPKIPDQPSVTSDVSNAGRPVLIVQINGDIRNVYGTNIRESDDITLVDQRVFGAQSDLRFEIDNEGGSRTLEFKVRMFNLMWEFSPVNTVDVNLVAPQITSLIVDEEALAAEVTTDKPADSVEFQVWKDISLTILAASGIQDTNVFKLSVEDVLQDRWFRARAFDALGPGAFSSTVAHTYTTTGVKDFNNTRHVTSVPVPPTPVTEPVVPEEFVDDKDEIIEESWKAYSIKRDSYLDE